MNVKFFVFCCIVSIAAHTKADDRTLLWSNGDSLPGTWKSLDGDALHWDSPLFQQTVAVDTQTLRAISFPAEHSLVEVKERFRADTASGEIIYGSLTAIDDAVVTLQNERYGNIALKRSELVSLRRLNDSAFMSLGGLPGWKTLDPNRDVKAWRHGNLGSISTDRRGDELFQRVDLPERVEVELAISWQKELGFVFSITQDDNVRNPKSVTIETWDDEVVVVTGNKFEPVQSVSQAEGRLHLRIYIDRQAGNVTVCSFDGRQLAQITGNPQSGGANRGVYLRNKRNNLALETLRIGRWNGQLPIPLSPGENRLHLVGGDMVYGVVKSYDSDADSLVVEGEDEQKILKVEQVDTLYFAAKPNLSAGGQAEVAFHDGALLRGKLEALIGNEATLRTASAEQSVVCKLDRCREINWPSKDQTPPTSGDVLYWEQGKCHGAVAGVDGKGFPIGWRATGSSTAVPLNESKSIRVVRRDVQTVAAEDAEFSDAIYLNDFTSLPCRVSEVDGKGARVATPFNDDPVFVPNDLLKALEFRRPGAIEGFDDARWVATAKDAVKIDASEAKFSKVGRLSHSAALAGSEVHFKLNWESQCRFQMRLQLFTETVKSASSTVTCSIVGGSSFLNVAGGNGRFRRSSNVKSTEAVFSIKCTRNRLVVEVNGEQVVQEDLVNGRPGRGIDFVMAALTNSRGQLGGWVRISEFSARITSGDSAIFVPQSVKDKVLTVPRLIKSNPPRHVLAAPNGDVLRGELISVDGAKVVFRSKLRDLNVPRQRVAGIVWFHEANAVPQRSGNTRVMLAEDRILALDPSAFNGDLLIGRSSVFGEARIPTDHVREIHLGDYEPPDALAPYGDWQLRDAQASP